MDRTELITYVRFNVPVGTGDLTSVKLGDWHGPNGGDTKAIMNDAVNQYLTTQQDQLDKCAEILVDVRHERQQTVRWESFALHMAYVCPEKCQELELESRLKLREHLIRDHGFVWQVPCKDRGGETVKEWSCFWDECGEKKVSVFDTEDHFREHLKQEHKNNHPKLVTHKQFEETLNKGRKVKQPLTMSPSATFTSRAQTGISARDTGLSTYTLPKSHTLPLPRRRTGLR